MPKMKMKPDKFEIPQGLDFATGVFKPAGGVVGEKKNYNLQPGVTEYQLWSASTIEADPTTDSYKARVLLEHKATKNIVAINSWHTDFADAERAIDLVQDSLNGTSARWVYNIWGETLDIHSSPRSGGTIQVIEVKALIWSMF